MKKKSRHFIRYALLGLGLLLVLGAAYRYYAKYISPTRIAFINYKDFQLARIEQALQGRWVQIESLPIAEVARVRHFDAVFVFGRGFQMSPEQLKTLQQAGYNGTHLYVEGATNANMDVTNLRGRDLDYVSGYLKYDGTKNYTYLLNYVRAQLNGKRYFVMPVEAPQPIPRNVFFYLDDAQVFASHDSFVSYARQKGFHKVGQPKIALVTSVPGPFNTNKEHINALIQRLEEEGYNVYPMASFFKRLSMLKAIAPDIVIFMPHGRLTFGHGDKVIDWLKEANIPMLTPLSVFEPHNKWMKDPKGMVGPLLSMSVVLPELDGGIAPYTLNALYQNEAGYDIFDAIPDRMDAFVDMVEKWLVLKRKANKDKKVAIYYFKGPGLNAMVAANMEVIPSLYQTLRALKTAGYKVTGLPANVAAFKEVLMRQGAVLGPYAKGAFDEFLTSGKPALVPVKQYLKWAQKDLKKDLYEAVVNKYGSAPGDYLAVYEGNNAYLAVARIEFGNVVLLPQPLPGLGDNTFELIHGAQTAPPHPYVAAYLWSRNAFQADAIAHFGTHGSLEFTPGKQIALSNYDWSDALIGPIPHFYIYTVSNIGEAMIAKRRSYATIISHLTPPFTEGGLYNSWRALRQKLLDYTRASETLQPQYVQNISEMARQAGAYRDLNLNHNRNLNEKEIRQLTNYVEDIANEKITSGLYTVGKPYSVERIQSTVALMGLDPLAHSMAALDVLSGHTSRKQLKNSVYFDTRYRRPAKRYIARVMRDTTRMDAVLAQIVSPQALDEARKWIASHKKLTDMEIVRTFIGMQTQSSPSPHAVFREINKADAQAEVEKVKELVIRILPFPDKKDFIDALRSEKLFRKYSGILDPETLEKAKIIAKAVPKMAEALVVAQDADVMALLRLMQKGPLYEKAFVFLDDVDLIGKAHAEKEKIEANVRLLCASEANQRFLEHLRSGSLSDRTKDWNTERLKALHEGLLFYQTNERLCEAPLKGLDINASLAELEEIMALRFVHEKQLAQAVLRIEESLRALPRLERDLRRSPSRELEVFVNGLSGGYVLPSAGGDIIANPSTLPTGRNLYSIDAEKTPSEEAWQIGAQMGEELLRKHQKQTGDYPRKVSFTLWPGDFIRTEGALVAQIFYLLGVAPVRDPYGRVMDIELVPNKLLQRPRIDVVVQTAGQFRDLAASRLFLIQKAVQMASNAKSETLVANYVAESVKEAEQYMKQKGLSPKEAKEFSTVRVFGGINGNYGTGIMGMVERGDAWENTSEVAQTYLHNMGAMYGAEDNWSAFRAGVFEAALLNTEVVIQPREANTWGALSLDHVYEFMGGLNLAVKEVTGKAPAAYFNDFRNALNPKMQEISEAIAIEARSTLLNPKYIKEYMKGGASSAEKFAETFRNTYGWTIMKTESIDESLWNDLHKVYVQDGYALAVHSFFEQENPYALQEMTAVMLETIRKGYWQASASQIEELVRLHTRLVSKYKAGCSYFVCGNAKLSRFIRTRLANEAQRQAYANALKTVRQSAEEKNKESVIMKEESDNNQQLEEERVPLYVVVWVISGLLVLLIGWVVVRRRKKES